MKSATGMGFYDDWDTVISIHAPMKSATDYNM